LHLLSVAVFDWRCPLFSPFQRPGPQQWLIGLYRTRPDQKPAWQKTGIPLRNSIFGGGNCGRAFCTSCLGNFDALAERPCCPSSPNPPLQINQPHPLRSCQALTCQNWACNGGDTPFSPQPTAAAAAAPPSSQAQKITAQPLTALPAPRKCSQWLYHTLISLDVYSQDVNRPRNGDIGSVSRQSTWL